MQYVSTEYREQMQKKARNKSYMRLSMGLINQTAQRGAEIEDGDFTPYSDLKAPLSDDKVTKIYASYEENWNSLDGSVYFLPRSGKYFQQAAVTNELASEHPSITIRFNTEDSVSLKGITLRFGKSWPTRLMIETEQGQVEYENSSREFVTEDTFDNITYMTFTALEMSRGETRFRLEQITCGIGLEFDDNKIISAKLASTISPIAENLPTIDFSVTIENMDKYYNVDNEDSAINYVETGQELKVYWGYGLDDGSIEWFKGATLYMQEWSADDTTAKFSAVDKFEYMDDEYKRGEYKPEGISLYALAEDVFEDAGIPADEYWIDPYLENIIVNNPLPAVSHKQCLQLIANAGRSVLMQNADGILMIKSSFIPNITASANAETEYSDATGLLENESRHEYASYETEFARVNRQQYFLPRQQADYVKCGFISAALAGEDGTFTENPMITLLMESAYTFHNITLHFGCALPKAFTLRTYRNGERIATYKSKSISQVTIVKYDFIDIDKIEIEFTKAKPLNRIHLMKVEFGEATDYTITYEDLFSPPTGKRLEKVKEMRVTRTIYAPGTERKDLTQEEIDTPLVPTEYEFSFSNAVHDLSVVCLIDTEEIDVGAEVVEQKTYWCKVRINNPPQVPIKVNLTIRGYEFGISTAVEAITLNNKGKIQSWDNPLISSVQDAQNLVTWVGEYYAAGNEYDLSFRGDPALEANDLTYLESQYVESLMIRLEEIETNYNGSISGKITARRKL